MLNWFNALFTLLSEFIQTLFQLPFYGNISAGNVLLAVVIFAVLLTVLIQNIK